VHPVGAALTSTRYTAAADTRTLLEKKTSKRVPCAGDGVVVKDVIVTVKVQSVGPVGTPEVDELPQPAHAPITIAQRRISVHVDKRCVAHIRQLSFFTQRLRTDTFVVASISIPNWPDWLFDEVESSSIMTAINWPLTM